MTTTTTATNDGDKIITRTREWWHRFFMSVASTVATASKDPSTQCGAVLVRPDKTIASTGYNGFPHNIPDYDVLYKNRTIKYKLIVHAEINTLAHCQDATIDSGYTLYTWPIPPCANCCLTAINFGVGTVVAPFTNPAARKRWQESFADSQYIVDLAGDHHQLIFVDNNGKEC